MRRRPDWKLRLMRWLDEQRRAGFAYGLNDCAMFASGAIEAMTGEDPAASWRGTYGSRDEAEAVLADHGGLAALVTALIGPPRPEAAAARQGDVGLIRVAEDGMETLCIVTSRGLACKTERGVAYLPRALLVTSWPVGEDHG